MNYVGTHTLDGVKIGFYLQPDGEMTTDAKFTYEFTIGDVNSTDTVILYIREDSAAIFVNGYRHRVLTIHTLWEWLCCYHKYDFPYH